MYDKEKFKGVLPALLTPFDKNDKVNAKSVDKLVKYNLAKGVNGFYVGGSTGEGLLLTKEERMDLFEYAAAANEGKSTLPSIRLICSIPNPERSATSSRESCLLSRMFLIFSPIILLFPILRYI